MNFDLIFGMCFKTLQARIKTSRFEHSCGVAKISEEMAKKFSSDELFIFQAKLAGLLHDCAREFPVNTMIDEAKKRNIFVGEIEKQIPLLLHAPLGAARVKELYASLFEEDVSKIFDENFLQAIAFHTVANENMSLLAKIIYSVDLFEPTRDYPGVERLRRIAQTCHSIDEIFLACLNSSITYVIKQNGILHINTILARNALLFQASGQK